MSSYVAPTPEEARALLAAWRLTGSSAAALIDVNPRTIRKWVAAAPPMPFAALAALAAQCGSPWRASARLSPATWRDALAPDLREGRQPRAARLSGTPVP